MEESEIKKPWAVYGWDGGSMGIGKIKRESPNGLWIEYCEGQEYFPECWDLKWVHQFNSPIKAMAYFLVHQIKNCEKEYNKRRTIMMFLNNFPSERKNIKNIEKILKNN